jgi:hypothetical protein
MKLGLCSLPDETRGSAHFEDRCVVPTRSSCHGSLLIRRAQRARRQAETPLSVLCRFPGPALTLRILSPELKGVVPLRYPHHNRGMGRERDEQISPELFAAAAAGGDTPLSQPKPTATDTTAEPTPVRHLLPRDLRGALKHLSDGELDSLRAATLEEIKRRGRLPSVDEDTRLSATHRVPSAHKKSHQRHADIPEAPLTRGQINAVRAAFKAGITPARIARQFGISQSNVRKALATDEPKP